MSDKDGSSPRVRGTRFALALSWACGRFIPACTGNSSVMGTARGPPMVHLRVYGELPGSGFNRSHCTGSSPRVRGTLFVSRGEFRHTRFIPACTGNSRRAPGKTSGTPVHPRVYGELEQQSEFHRLCAGSSPRVRGTPPRCGEEVPVPRLIPACTGNSLPRHANAFPSPVHPRVYGELGGISLRGRPGAGSSPRVRGTRTIGAARKRTRRFIPACTGNSRRSWRTGRIPLVHPRVYGELSRVSETSAAGNGSSPRVRGTLQVDRLGLAG